MEKISDQEYLKNRQYKTDANLQARIQIHRRFSRNPYGWYRWAFERMHLQAGEQILDVGCGPADIWKSQSARLPQDARLVLCDLSSGMARAAKTDLGADPRFGFATGDAQALPFRSASFDLVVANHMLYHVPDIHQAVREIRRVLRRGGRLVAGTNGRTHLLELYDLIASVVPDFSVGRNSAARFGVENGVEYFRDVFSEAGVELYEDSLWVTETAPLVEYIGSMGGLWLYWNETVQRQLCDRIETEIGLRGGFLIQKSSGIIWAR